MDTDKLHQWLEIAKKFNGGDFWSDIFDPSASAKQAMNKHPFFKESGEQAPGLGPRVDVLVSPTKTIVLIDLPGIRKEDVQLSWSGEHLYVKGVAKPLHPEATAVTSERINGEFERTIRLPEKIDEAAAKISATFHNGLLEVHIPTSRRPRKSISIE